MEVIRAGRTHATALREFRCAADVPYEKEVEDYINQHLSSHMHRGVLLLIDRGEVIGVGEHVGTFDPYGSGRLVTYLQVLALNLEAQGRRIGDGSVTSADALLSALINDGLRAADRERLVSALVAEDNRRAQRLITREPFEFEEVPPRLAGLYRDGNPATYLYFERRYK